MTKEEIRELIQTLIHEYTGTGDMSSTGLTSDDGNNVTSQRPFYDEENELEYYTNQGAPYGGAEGNHYRKDSDPFNYNRSKFTKF
tara:strand:+ start:2627 stop:2881 length:255 start_codon:yes stop_codon:yes gene_type:complete